MLKNKVEQQSKPRLRLAAVYGSLCWFLRYLWAQLSPSNLRHPWLKKGARSGVIACQLDRIEIAICTLQLHSANYNKTGVKVFLGSLIRLIGLCMNDSRKTHIQGARYPSPKQCHQLIPSTFLCHRTKCEFRLPKITARAWVHSQCNNNVCPVQYECNTPPWRPACPSTQYSCSVINFFPIGNRSESFSIYPGVSLFSFEKTGPIGRFFRSGFG